MKLTVIILNFNTKDLTLQCLRSLRASLTGSLKNETEVVVVDNASTDNSVETIKQKFPWVKLIQSKSNLGFAGGNNLGIKKARGEFVLLLNSDTILEEKSLSSILAFMEGSEFSIVSCKLVNQDGSFQPSCGNLPSLPAVFFWLSNLDNICSKMGMIVSSFHQISSIYYKNGRKVGWVSGAVMLIKKELFKEIGLLDENIFMYSEDVEFCLRANRNKRLVGWTDQAVVTHLGGKSSHDPALVQWRGEFSGLLYIYDKYYSGGKRVLLYVMIYLFATSRALVYLLTGRFKFGWTYLKVLFSLKQVKVNFSTIR